MKTTIPTNIRMRYVLLSGVLTVGFGLYAQADLYTTNFSDSGAIPQGGTSFSIEHSISGIGTTISSAGVTLALTFNDNYDLNGNIQGTLILDPSGSDTFASFTPSATGTLSPGTNGQEVDTVTFSGDLPAPGAFYHSNPNYVWALELWDNNNSGIENGLVSWSLDVDTVSPVPEPTTYALTLFGLVFIGGGVGRFCPGRLRRTV